jgi:DNA-binding CsgD family transcriptional regulator
VDEVPGRRQETTILSGITPREQTVLLALGMRLTNREISELLHISRRTVESHVASLLRKLSVSSRQDLIQLTSSLKYSAGELQAVEAATATGGAGRRSHELGPATVVRELEPPGATVPPASQQHARRSRTEELFRLAFDHAPIGMQLVAVAPDGRWTIVRTNTAMAALFGEEPAALVGRVLDGFSPANEGTPDGSPDRFGAEQRIRFHRGDGTDFVAEARSATIGHPEENDALALIRVVELTAEPSARAVSRPGAPSYRARPDRAG